MADDAMGRPRSANLNVPNAITVLRILLAPVFLWLLFADAGGDGPLRWAAAALFIAAIATDGIDGHIARSRGLVTDLGKLLDPIADKVITGAALVGLSILDELPWWVTIVVLVREVGVTVHRMVVLSDHVVAAAWMGKLKTVVQAIAVSFALVPLDVFVGDRIVVVNIAIMAAAVVLTIASGIDYVGAEARGARADRAARRGSE